MIAAPLREGTYQPSSFRPSPVLNVTVSCAMPSVSAGTPAVATWAPM